MRKQFIVPAFYFIIFCSSCTNFVQKSYFASSPNLNCFQKDREINVKLSGSFSHIDLQSNAALSDKFGLSVSAFLGNKMQYGFELDGIWYKHLKSKSYFEIQGGFGNAHIDCSKNLTLEPAIKFRYKFFFVQLSGVFSQNIGSTPVYTEHYTGEDYDLSLQSTEYAGKAANPQHVRAVVTCGFEYKFGRKKTGTTSQP